MCVRGVCVRQSARGLGADHERLHYWPGDGPFKGNHSGCEGAAVNSATNLRYESATNGAGGYTLANLSPGAYRIEEEKSFIEKFREAFRPD